LPDMVRQAIVNRADSQESNPGSARTCESQEAGLLSRLLCFLCVYGQRNGKPLPPVAKVPDVQARTPPCMYQPLGLAVGAP
jgi:hypothetical protein